MNYTNLFLSWSVDEKKWKMPILQAANFLGLLQFRLVRRILDIKEDRLLEKISNYVNEHFEERESLKQSYHLIVHHQWKIKSLEQLQKDWASILRPIIETQMNAENFWRIVDESIENKVDEIFIPFLKQTVPTFMLKRLKENAISLDRLSSDSYRLAFEAKYLTHLEVDHLDLNGFQWHFLMLESTFFKGLGDNPSLKEGQNRSVKIENFTAEEMNEFLSQIWKKEPEIDENNFFKMFKMADYFGSSRLRQCAVAYLSKYLIQQDDFHYLLNLAVDFEAEGLNDLLAVVKNCLKIKLEKAAQSNKLNFICLLEDCKKQKIFLEELDLSNCSLVDDDCLAKLASWPLKKLNLFNCENITDGGLISLAKSSSLEQLDLSVRGVTSFKTRLNILSKITDNGILALAPLKSLKHLNLSHLSITNESLKLFKNHLGLEYLDLSGCSNINDQGLKFLENHPSLQHLDLTDSCISDEGINSIATIQSLKDLILQACEKITNKGLDSLTNLPSLQHLDLSYWMSMSANVELESVITNESLKSISHLKSLKYLNLAWSSFNITDTGLEFLAGLNSLEYLNLSQCHQITDQGLESISKLKLLKHLDLSWSKNITDLGLAVLNALTSLNYLNLNLCHQITDQGIVRLTNLKLLTHLELEACPIKNLDSLAIFSLLENLNLSQCHQITNLEMSQLTHLPSLKYLNLSWLDISEEGLEVLPKLKNLTHLDLTSSKVTDSGLKIIAKSVYLEDLILRECHSINSKGIAQLVELPFLKNLDLARIEGVQDSCLKSLSNSQSLRYLTLYDCPNISNQGLKWLSDSQSLEHLDIEYCKRISNQGLSSLVTIPSLKRLNIVTQDIISQYSTEDRSSITLEDVAQLMASKPGLDIWC